MSYETELIHKWKEAHQRLVRPPNAVKDKPIDLHPNRIPSFVVEATKAIVQEYLTVRVKIEEIKAPPRVVIPKIVSINAVFESVCDLYGVDLEHVKTCRSRKRGLSYPRQIGSYLAMRHTGLSSVAIARYLNQHHTSVLHSHYKIEELLLVDEKLAENVRAIETSLFLGEYD